MGSVNAQPNMVSLEDEKILVSYSVIVHTASAFRASISRGTGDADTIVTLRPPHVSVLIYGQKNNTLTEEDNKRSKESHFELHVSRGCLSILG